MNFLEEIQNLCNQNLLDKEIANKIGKSHTFVRNRRLELNIKSSKEKKNEEILNKISFLHSKGLCDREIARELGLDSRTIGFHRKKLSVPSNRTKENYMSDTDRIKGYMVRNSKFMAKRRKIEFNLSFQDFELPENCPLLGIKLSFRSESNGNDPHHASLDRIDNNKGYVKGNVIVISRLANAMKNSADFKQLKSFCKNILHLINLIENQGALGSITDIFPDVKLKT